MLVRPKSTAKYTPSSTDNTPLHTLLREAYSLEQILEFIHSGNPHDIAVMAKTCNQDGKIPLDFLYTLSLEFGDEIDVAKALIPILKKHPFKPLSEQLSIDTILQRYYSISDVLKNSFELACEAVNFVRQTIKFSSTHPDFNHYSLHEQRSIERRIIDMRKKYSPLSSPSDIYSLCQQESIGNCNECAFSAIYYLNHHSSIALYAYIVSIVNGDHTFVVFSPNALKDPNDYLNQSSQAVFCDPWGGHVGVYNQHDLTQFLGSYKSFGISTMGCINLVSTFHPGFHQLEFKMAYKIHGTKPKAHYSIFQFFSQVKQTLSNTFSIDKLEYK